MQLPPSEVKKLTQAVCPEPGCRTPNPVYVDFGATWVRCKSCGNDFLVKSVPAWMDQQMGGWNGQPKGSGDNRFSSYPAGHLAARVNEADVSYSATQPKAPRSPGAGKTG